MTTYANYITFFLQQSTSLAILLGHTSVSGDLDRKLLDVAIGALIAYALAIWEFSIGIKKSIKKLFTGNK